MSRRDWLPRIAVRGCLILLPWITMIGDAQLNAPNYDPPQNASAAAGSKKDETKAKASRRDEIPDAADYSPDCQHPEKHDDADYCQQIRMADAAEQAIVWAEV